MGWGDKEGPRLVPGHLWDVPRESVWVWVTEKRTPSFGVSPVGCLMVGVAGGRQEGTGVGAATGGAAAPGSVGSGDSVGFGGAWQAWGISWGWGCQEQVSLHEGPSPGAQRSPVARGLWH